MWMEERVVDQTTGQVHGQIQVVERGRTRYMRFGKYGGWQGAMRLDAPDSPIFGYQRAFGSLLGVTPEPARFLSLGVGTGTGLRAVQHRFPQCELVGVDIESSVIDAATNHFCAPSHQTCNYWVGDGVHFLCNVDLSFDLIFVDAYMSNRVYDPCIDPAFAHVLSAALTDEGYAACNLIARLPLQGQVKRFLDEAAQVFEEVLLLPVGLPYTEQNMLAVFSKTERNSGTLWRQALRHNADYGFLERIVWPLRLRMLPTGQK